MLYPTTWTEESLRKAGYKFINTFECRTCHDEISVYDNYHGKRIYLCPDMSIHPNHGGDYDEGEERPSRTNRDF